MPSSERHPNAIIPIDQMIAVHDNFLLLNETNTIVHHTQLDPFHYRCFSSGNRQSPSTKSIEYDLHCMPIQRGLAEQRKGLQTWWRKRFKWGRRIQGPRIAQDAPTPLGHRKK